MTIEGPEDQELSVGSDEVAEPSATPGGQGLPTKADDDARQQGSDQGQVPPATPAYSTPPPDGLPDADSE